ncbi:glycosyltransferase family 2 protein [Bacillus sp. S3]|uniref:glycosyltransferase family 2 protein n=1 Tax=Bacillus sp. S3 TaxID=486398 RepID=UPI00118AD893|nr:glycosyltransferase [Bacillus sp. S3]QCJ41551.1 glycosyltransferase family 2 protein [Bacillus sp. S3]
MLGNSFKWSESIKKESRPKETKQSHQISNSLSSSINKNNQDIEVSIIIPSQNKYPLNLFTLYSLELQTFNPAKMEVILINDASTDQTEEKLKDYSPPYHFKYIHSKKNLGRAKGRNLGIRSARGSILIFLDAEILTEPDFVEKHYKYHQSKHNLILSGGLHSKILYSCVFPDFSKKEVNRITYLTEKNQEIFQRLQGCKDVLQEPYPLLDRGDLVRKTYRDIAYKEYPWFRQITRNFGADLEGFTLPWMAFLTRNVSIRKELIVDAGLFDEEFHHYGYEDWELGYRLYKMGAQYVVSDELTTYHQEHPVVKNKWKETIANFGLFTVKHHEVDVLILGLELSGLTDLLTMNKVLRDYKLFQQLKSEHFQIFQEKFVLILETIILMLQVDISPINILGAAGFGTNDRNELLNDVNNLTDYPHLKKFLQQVINS